MAERAISIFGKYAEKLQVMIDNSLDKFEPVWWKNYFDWGVPKTTLTYETAIGRSRIEAAASVVDSDSPAPLRSRNKLEKLRGEVAAIKEKFVMSQADYREWEALKNLNVGDGTKLKAMLDLIYNHVKIVADASMKRLDAMTLQGISYGYINMSLTNNPDGIVTGDLDLLMPTENNRKVVDLWSNPTTAQPVTDFLNAVEDAEDKGRKISKALMTRTKFWQMRKTDEVIKMLNVYFRVNTNAKRLGTQDEINEMLEANGLPIIELVNEVIGIESDGVISTYKPFREDSVVFIPDGKLGVIHNAIAIEELHPVAGVSYGKYERALISKWSQNDPFAEYTGVELNAFPGFEAIDGIYILDTATAIS